jgi:hypothetical protein
MVLLDYLFLGENETGAKICPVEEFPGEEIFDQVSYSEEFSEILVRFLIILKTKKIIDDEV